MIAAMVAAWLAGSSPAAGAPCQAIAGVSAVWGKRDLRWLIVGETHGTVETPAAFANLVCLAAAARGPVVVALEYSVGDQARIADYLASNGGPAARASLLEAQIWHNKLQDGRASSAFLTLFDRLRMMMRAGLVKRVVAFQASGLSRASGVSGVAAYEQAMARTVEQASTNPHELVVALVGNLHAVVKRVTVGTTTYTPMAGLLPQSSTLTLNAVGAGGSQWACLRIEGPVRAGLHNGCGVQDFGIDPMPRPRGVVLGREKEQRWSGRFDLGVKTTASLPAVAPDADAHSE